MQSAGVVAKRGVVGDGGVMLRAAIATDGCVV